MERSGNDAQVVAAEDGVTLRKRFEETEYRLPTIAYEFRSDRAEPVTVRVIETIPDALDPEDVGFVDANGTDAWEIKGPALVFEDEIEPDAEYAAACAARGENAAAIEEILGRPDAFEVEPPSGAGATPAPAADFTRNARTARSDAVVSRSRAGRSNDEAGSDRAVGKGGSVAVADDRAEPRVVEQLVAELRDGEAGDENVALLKDALGIDERPKRSLETRIRQLQSDLADVRAYSNTVEEFLDRHGSAEEVVRQLESRLDAVEEAVDGLRSTVETNGATVAAVREDVDDVAAETHSVSAAVDRLDEELAAEVSSLRSDLERLEDRLPASDVDERLSNVEGELSAVDESVSAIDGRVSTLDERLAEMDDQLSDVEAFSDTLRSAFRD